VTSGNEASGVEVSHTPATTQNQIVGNFIGTDVTGQAATAWSANDYTGITLEDGVSNNVVAYNVVGNNRTGGIQITEFTTQSNQIYNNWVGIAPNGNPIGNLDFGIRADGVGNVIGPNNIIAYNEYNGIVIRADGADFNRITRNTIYNNGALSIDLLPDWITLNDPGDADTGPNENLNFPVLDSATTAQVTGTACAGCVVEVYLSDSGAGAYGEGQTFAGSATADGSGNFTAPISGAVSGSWVTATATDSAGNTSEFSLNLQVP
jgi:hypothetical protein